MRSSIIVHEIDKKFLWTEEHIAQTEKLFDDVFELFMEEKFLESVYLPNKSSLTKEEFAKRFQSNKHFTGKKNFKDGDVPKTAFWVFSPNKVSSVFNQLLKGTIREECFLIEKIDWQDERNEILSLESFETYDTIKVGLNSARVNKSVEISPESF